MDQIREFKISEYVLEVRVSNSGAVRLYQELHDFKKIRIIGHYYRDSEDAYYMAALNKEKESKKITNQDFSGMTDKEIKQHFLDKNQGYLLYNCPNCDSLQIKELTYSLAGTVDPDNKETVVCADCNKEMTLYDIAQGKYNSFK